MNRVAMILGAGLMGMAVATAAGSSGRSTSMHPSSGQHSSGQQFTKQGFTKQGFTKQSFTKQQGAMRGELTRVYTQQKTNKGNTTPTKGKFDPNKIKIDPNKGKVDPNKLKFDPNKGKNLSKIDPFRRVDQKWGRGIVGKNGQFLSNRHVTGDAFKKLPDKHHKTISGLAQSKNVTAPQKAALNKINNGQQLSTQDRQTLTNMRSNPPADMTPEAREAIDAALTLDGQASKVERYTRFLRLYNETGESLKVSVQYHTYTDKNTWSWFPSPPASEEPKAVSYSLPAGKSTMLIDGQDGWVIHASRVRVWGKTASGMVFDEFHKDDLVLVPEVNKKGEPSYIAAEQETYTYTFSAEAAVATKQ